jgi:arylformamidase
MVELCIQNTPRPRCWQVPVHGAGGRRQACDKIAPTMKKEPASKPWDGAWLDRMYNNRELVPEHPEHLRRWAAASADAMRTLPRELDVRYGGGPNEHLDIFPAAQADAPVLFFIHGGYWRALDKRDHSFVAPAFAREGVGVVINN